MVERLTFAGLLMTDVDVTKSNPCLVFSGSTLQSMVELEVDYDDYALRTMTKVMWTTTGAAKHTEVRGPQPQH